MWDAKVEINPLVRFSRDQIANTIYISNTRRDPLVAARLPIAYCPYVLWVCSSDNFQVITKSLKTYTTPNIEMCFGMTIGHEVVVKSVFVKGVGATHFSFPRFAISKLIHTMASDKFGVRKKALR